MRRYCCIIGVCGLVLMGDAVSARTLPPARTAAPTLRVTSRSRDPEACGLIDEPGTERGESRAAPARVSGATSKEVVLEIGFQRRAERNLRRLRVEILERIRQTPQRDAVAGRRRLQHEMAVVEVHPTADVEVP